MDDVDEAEEEGHLCGHLGDVGKQPALGQDFCHWGDRQGCELRAPATPEKILQQHQPPAAVAQISPCPQAGPSSPLLLEALLLVLL